MEILQFLISFFAKEYGLDKFAPILNCLKENSYDLKKTLLSLKPEVVAPILQSLFSNANKTNPRNDNGGYGLQPITWIADMQIVDCLNGYFTS